MPLINTSLPNLIQGVSQQPDAVRYDGQCEEQENALSSVVEGLQKRPAAEFVGTSNLIDTALSEDTFFHLYKRSDAERYCITQDNNTLRIHNADTGVKCTITEQTTSDFTITNNEVDTTGTYFASTKAKENLKGLTIGDSTFLLNKEQETAIDTTTATTDVSDDVLIFIKQGDYKKKYGFTTEGTLRQDSSALITFKQTYSGSNPRRYNVTNTFTISSSLRGKGFTAGDIVDIPLPPSRSYLSNTTNKQIISGDVNIITQPTFKVLTVGAQGQILTGAIENSGNWNYMQNTGVGGGSNLDVVSFHAVIHTTDTSTPSTPTTPLTLKSRTAYQSAAASGNNASVIDSSVILSGIEEYFYSQSDSYFVLDAKNSENNLLILKNKKLPSGLSLLKDLSVSPVDGLSGNGIGIVHREVSSLADLPTIAPHNFKVKVIGDAELGQDDFYCEFKSASNEPTDGDVGQGSWVECAGAVINDTIDSATMPRLLVSVAPNVFEIRRMSFNKLKAGDTDSNPYPSFLDNKINNVFQYKNRLGFLAQDTVIMSEAGFGGYDANANLQSYNFFRTTVTDLLDGDPIDVSVSSNNVTTLRSAQPFQENLILFSDNSQFVLKGGELLTPKSVSVTAVTNFDTVKSVDPIPLGSYLYFPFQRGGFSGVREFTINATADIYDAVEITAHVPQYIPNNLTSLTGSNSEQIIAMTSGTTASSGSETDIYIYKYFFNNQQKGLSSWSKFSVVGAVRGIKFIDSELYVLQSKNGKTNLLRIFLEAGRQDPSGYNTHLDMRISATVGGAVSDIQLPYTPESTDTVQVYTDDGLLLESSVNGSVVTLTSPPSATTTVYVGLKYSMKYVFSRLVFKAPAGNSKSPSNANDFLIRNGSIFFNNSASFKVKVQPDGREEQINEFTPTVIGTQLPDEFKLTDGAFRFPIFTKASSAKITLENNTALPCNLQSAEFESFIHARSNRYG